jgi:hypothetical protein
MYYVGQIVFVRSLFRFRLSCKIQDPFLIHWCFCFVFSSFPELSNSMEITGIEGVAVESATLPLEPVTDLWLLRYVEINFACALLHRRFSIILSRF